MSAVIVSLRLATLSGLPRNQDGPVFKEPWQAHAFALALNLHERGAYTWAEWAAALAQAIAQAQTVGDPDHGDTYYHHWLDALERLMIDKGLAAHEQIHALESAWAAAAERTPHGQPIELSAAERALAR